MSERIVSIYGEGYTLEHARGDLLCYLVALRRAQDIEEARGVGFVLVEELAQALEVASDGGQEDSRQIQLPM